MDMDKQVGAIGADDDPQYIIDKILNKRIVRNKVQYYISWLGYPKEENCWVSQSDICPGEVEVYEKGLKMKRERKTNKKSPRLSVTPMKRKRTPNLYVLPGSDPGQEDAEEEIVAVEEVVEVAASESGGSLPQKVRLKGWSKALDGSSGRDVTYPLLTGFARGLLPDKILAIGSHEVTGMVMLLMKWKDLQQAEFVPCQEVKEKCPQVLIAYFQEWTVWI